MATEKRMIDANALLEEHCGGCSLTRQKLCENDPVCGSAMWIIEAPTVDAVEVVHGEWSTIEDDYTGMTALQCSECNEEWWF